MQATKKYFYLPNKALCRVYNCCDLNRFKNSKNKIEIKLGKTIKLGMVARLEQHKDHETLIKSIAEMPAEEKQLLKDIYQVDYDLPGNPTTPEEAALWKAPNG